MPSLLVQQGKHFLFSVVAIVVVVGFLLWPILVMEGKHTEVPIPVHTLKIVAGSWSTPTEVLAPSAFRGCHEPAKPCVSLLKSSY
jgi:hypothetical protein